MKENLEKPRVVVPLKSKDLDELIGGEIIRVTHKKPYRNWEIYGGLINGEDCFMHQYFKNPSEIISIRIPRDDINVDKTGHYGVLANVKSSRIVLINPKNPGYLEGKEMLIAADMWSDNRANA